MTNDPNIEPTQPSTPSPYESGAAEKPVEHVAQELAAPATEQPAEPTTPRYQRPTPYQTHAKPDEIKRESENRAAAGLPNHTIEDVCRDWGIPVPLEFDAPAQGTLSS